MTRKNEFAARLEPERYEIHSPVSVIFETDRRDFFKFLGAGVFVICAASKTAAFQESGRGRGNSEENLPREIDAWLHIAEKGEITVFTGKVEVGQNIRTSLSQAVAEELCVPIGAVTLIMGDTQLVPFDMGTFGSRTTPVMNLQLRRVSAAARDVLTGLAAKQWNTDAKNLSASGGKIIDSKGNRSATYAELVKGQQITELLPPEDPLIPASQWRVAGQPVSKVNGRDFVTGKHRYPSDCTAPGMLYGKVVRPPCFGATLVSANTAAAEGMPGVVVVRDGNFLAVAAPSSALAEKAAAAIRPEWKSEPQISSKELFDYLRKNPAKDEELETVHQAGEVQKVFASSSKRLNSTFNIAYIAHAPLEPRAALAQWNGDEVTVWTGTQRPFGVRSELATAFHLPEEKVHVLMPDMGSGYGGKHTGETALEAARLARAAKRPVKVVWTRQEEFTWAYFRPAGVIDVTSAVDGDGKITAWEFHNYNSGTAGSRTYYDIPNQRIVFHPVNSPLRQGSYRALAATANHFAREVHMDEIAASLQIDPLQFRLTNLKEERLRAVFEQGSKQFGWDKPRASNHGFGVGGGYEKLGYIATFVEVSLKPETGEIKIERVLTAFDCGAVVNPDGVRNQLIGANIMGIGGAVFEAIEFEDGRIINDVFSKYRVPRFRDVPPMDALLIDRTDQPAVGAGEAPILGIAPALANAIYAVTKARVYALPMGPQLTSHGFQLA
jgi:CO/xanthine dehydrogenase Mo-binding subunit